MSRRTPLIALGFLLLLVTCRDGMEPQLRLARVAVAPVLPSERSLASFGLTLDRVRFIVVRGGFVSETRASTSPDTLADTTVALPPDLAALDLNLRVPLIAAAETLEVSIVALAGTIPLFQGAARVEVLSGGTPATPTEIPVLTYVGPGAGVDSLAISPSVPFIYFNDSLRFQVQAFQAGVPVAQFYVSWGTSDSTVARVNGAGVLRAPTSRTAVRVIARVPGSSVADSTTATFVPVPTQLAIISGAGQSGIVGQALATPLEVEVRAADNLPVGGVAVRFRAPAGGSPADTTITTGPSGRALVNASLGASAGNQTFQVSLPAFPSVVASFTASATSTTISAATSTVTVSTGTVLSGNTVKLRLQGKDASGTNITTGGDVVIFSSSGGSSTGTISATADSGNGVYTAVFSGVLAGTGTTINATINGIAISTVLPTITVTPGSISTATSAVTASASTVISGDLATLRLRAKDAAGNLLATGGDVVAFGTSGASSGAISAAVDSGNGVYTATFTGQAAGTASTVTATVNGSPVTSGSPSITVTPGAAAQLAFTVQPTNALVATPITPAVEVTARDAYGNTTPAFTGAVTIAIGTNPSGGLLSGTLSPSALSGLAQFTDLQIDQAGVGYTLTAAAGGLASVTSGSFDVIVPSGTIAWSNPAGGNWSTATNWAGGVVPGSANTAVITLPGTYTVTVDVNPTVNGLQLGGSSGTQTLSAASRTLTVTGTTQVSGNGVLQLRSSTLTGANYSNSGALFVDGLSTINAAVATATGSTIRIQGDNGLGRLIVPTGFTNNGQITLTDSNAAYGASLQVTNGTLTNSAAGNLAVLPGTLGPKTISAELANQGTVGVGFPATLGRLNATISNSGTINVTGGNLVISQSGAAPSFTNTGAITVAVGDTVKISNGVFAYGAGSISGRGVLSLTSLTASIATAVNTGTIPLQLSSVTINGAGTLTNALGATLDLQNTLVNIPVINQGQLIVTGASNRISGSLTSAAGSGLRIRGSNGLAVLQVDQSWTNNGSIVLTDSNAAYGAKLSMPTATLTNAVGGSISSLVGLAGPRDLNVELDNQGSMTVNRPTSINRASASHSNSGTITLSGTGANLTVTQTGTAPAWATTGTISIAPNDTFKVITGSFDYSAGTIGGGGVLSLSSVNATTSQPFSTANAGLDLQSSTWSGAGILTNAASTQLSMTNSTVATPFVNQGTFVVHGFNSQLTGSITTVTGSAMRIQGNNGAAMLTVANGFTNNALLELTDSLAAYGATLKVNTGTLTNAAGGTISAPVAANGPRNLTAQLDNQGTLSLARDLTMNAVGAAHVNSGTITLSGGNLIVAQTGASPSFTTSGTISIGTGDTVRISTGTFVYNAGTISGGGALTIVNATATANQNFSTATNGLDLQTSTWGGTGVLTVAPSTQLSIGNSTIATPFVNQGTFVAHGASSQLTGAVTTASGSAMRVQGNNGAAILTVATGFTNNGFIEITDSLAAYGGTLKVSTGTLTNAPGGTIAALTGVNGPRTLDAQLDNQGALNIALAAGHALTLQHAGAAHQNTGSITVSGGSFTISQTGSSPSFTSTGAITVGTGDTLTVSSGAFALNGGTLGGAGTLEFTAAANASFTVAHSIAGMVVTSSTVTFATPQNTGATGFVLSNSTVNGPGSLTNDPGKTLSVGSSIINTALDNQGTVIVSGSSSLKQAITTSAGSQIRVKGSNGAATLTADNGFTNNGTIELTDTLAAYGATLNVTTGTLINAVGATIAAVSGAAGPRNLNAALNNQGTLTAAPGIGRVLTINKASATHQNSGTIDVTAGDLTITQSGTTPSFTNDGAINIAANDTLTINGGAFTHNSGTLGGSGALVLTNVVPASFNVAQSVAAMLASTSTVNFATAQSTGATGFSFASSTINGPGALTNDAGKSLNIRSTTVNTALTNLGTMVVNGASAFNDTLVTASGSLLRVKGDNGAATLNVPKGFENAGRLDLTDTLAAYGATLGITGGKLVNLAGSAINILAGANGGRALNVALDNQGGLSVTLAAARTLTMNPPIDAALSNTGTILVNGGSVRIVQTGTNARTTNSGAISIASTDTVSIGGGVFSFDGGALDGPGALSLSNVTQANFSKPHTLGAILLSSSTANFAPDQSTGATDFQLSSATVNGPGVLTNAGGKTLVMQSSIINADLVNQGTLITRGATTLNGAVTTAAGSLIRVQGANGSSTLAVTTAGGLINGAGIELTDTLAAYGATLKVTGGPLVNATGATLDVQVGANGSRFIDAMLDNKGTLTVNRAATLSGTSPAHTNSGVIKVTGGDLTVQPGGANPSLTNLAGGSIDIGTARTMKVTTGTVLNSAGARISGFGTLDAQTPATLANNGDLFPGASPGVMTIATGTGSMPFSSSSSLNIEIGGTTPGTQYDQLAVTGSVSWAGILNVSLISGFIPTSGQQFILATCSVSCSNRFGVENLPPQLVGASINYTGNQIRLTAP